YCKIMADQTLGFRTHLAAFIPEDDIHSLRKGERINDMAVHLCSQTHLWRFLQECSDVCINYIHPAEATPRGHYYLGIIKVYRIFGTDNLFNTKPVCQPDDCTNISRILNAVQHELQSAVRHELRFRNFNQCQRITWVLQETDLLEFRLANRHQIGIGHVQTAWIYGKYFPNFIA